MTYVEPTEVHEIETLEELMNLSREFLERGDPIPLDLWSRLLGEGIDMSALTDDYGSYTDDYDHV